MFIDLTPAMVEYLFITCIETHLFDFSLVFVVLPLDGLCAVPLRLNVYSYVVFFSTFL